MAATSSIGLPLISSVRSEALAWLIAQPRPVKRDAIDDPVLDAEHQRDPVAAQRIRALVRRVGVLDDPEIVGPPIVLEDVVAVEVVHAHSSVARTCNSDHIRRISIRARTLGPRRLVRPAWSVQGALALWSDRPMATMIVSPLLARVVGQASRRGLILRVPSGESLLESVETWLLAEYGDSVRSMSRRVIEGGDAELSVALHPAAPELVMSANESGRVALTAETEALGPGYHRFIGRLVERLGADLSITWDRGEPDPGAILDGLGTTFADRTATERAYLGWLGQTLVKARAGRAAHGTQLQIGIPGSTRYTFDGAIATVLGPRDDRWLDSAVADTRVATDITPWWADATDGQALLNRALALMWLDVRWRAPAIKEERELLDEVHRTLTRAYPTDPTLAYPWRAWAELIEMRGIDDPMSRQVLVRADREGGDGDADRLSPRRRSRSVTRDGRSRSPVPTPSGGRPRSGGAAASGGTSPSPRSRRRPMAARWAPRRSSTTSAAISGLRRSTTAPAA